MITVPRRAGLVRSARTASLDVCARGPPSEMPKAALNTPPSCSGGASLRFARSPAELDRPGSGRSTWRQLRAFESLLSRGYDPSVPMDPGRTRERCSPSLPADLSPERLS